MSSLIIGPEDPSRNIWEMSLEEFLTAAVRRSADQVFAEIAGQRVTYRQLLQRARQSATLFHSLGVGHGQQVALFLPNCPEFLYCWFGLSILGAVAVPVNTAYKRDETAYILNDSQAIALVAHESLAAVAQAAADLAPGIEPRRRLLVGGGTAPGWSNFNQALAGMKALPLAGDFLPPVSPHDLSMLVYTSGTTGNPKGVQVTHSMYVAAGQGFAHWTQATAKDRFFTCLPYFHANAQYYSTMGALAVGGTLVVADRFSASRFWEQVREAQATVVNFIGMMLPVLAKQPPTPQDRQSNVRLFYGSPAFPPQFLQEFQERFGIDIIVGFGMTETCFGTIERLGQPRRAGSSGQYRQHPDPRFENQIRIADAETGEPLGANAAGEITIKNSAITPGYWRNPEQTQQALRDGWLFTGDLGWLDEDGFLFFVDRKKDVIRRRGENISSQQVEEVVKRHPAVLDCAAIAVPSELGEDEVKVYVMPRPGAALQPAEVVHWCAEHLAYFKVPRYVELREELPRTPSLRVRKDLLRQERADLTQGCFDREQAGIKLR
ncbi:MAG: ATP-dependent acyl-CoA ligase [Dehalococcoidia bacterium]|nr:ATP-dependent acyl-CoA ligase [Dehalococcoidia bacterium]MSQ17544.1 ATP-dependent acyl-CoA ligase [Dehalococcoidia bacterium]